MNSYSRKPKFAWDRFLGKALLKLFDELLKYKNQVFLTTTHDAILKLIKLKEKQGFIEIISCNNIGERYLWHTLVPPFEKVTFYKITFRIK